MKLIHIIVIIIAILSISTGRRHKRSKRTSAVCDKRPLTTCVANVKSDVWVCAFHREIMDIANESQGKKVTGYCTGFGVDNFNPKLCVVGQKKSRK